MEESGTDPAIATKETPKEDRVYSDNLEDVVRVKCGYCGNIFKKTLSAYHTKSAHPGQSTNFEFLKKVYHR